MPPSPGSSTIDEPLHVLLVEDNRGDARLFHEYLQDSSRAVTLHHEETLAAGLAALDAAMPSVIVLDLGLPDSEGAKTVRRCVERDPSVPVVVLTGADRLETALSALQAGAAEYLQKDELTPSLVERTLRWAIEQHALKRQMREREARYRAIAESAQDAIVTMDADSTIQFANPAVEDVFGYVPEALIGEPITMLMPERHRDEHLDALDRHLRTGERTMDWTATEFPGLRKDGTEIDLSISFSSYVQQGETYFEGIMREVTERKNRERKLRVLSEAMEQAKEAIVITEPVPLDESGPSILYVNSAFETMTGYAEGEVLGETLGVLEGPETRPAKIEERRSAQKAGTPWEGETLSHKKDENLFVLHQSIAPVRDEAGDIEYWVAVLQDVTTERIQQHAVRHSQERYQSLFEDSNDAILIHNLNGQITEANSRAGTLFGDDPAGLVGRSIESLYASGASETAQHHLDALEAEGAFRDVSQFERVDGSTFWGELSASVCEIGGHREVRTMIRDVTDRKTVEEELRDREAQLRDIANSVPGVVYQFVVASDGTYRFDFISERSEDILGLPPDPETFFEQGIDRVPPEYREQFLDSIEEAIDAEETWYFEAPYVKPSGERIWVMASSTPTRREGELVFNGVFLDVTARKEEERRREQVICRVTDAIVEVDAEWRFTLVNEQAEELYGMAEADLLGKDFWTVFESALGTRFEGTYRRVMQTREPDSLVERFPQLDGWFDVQVYPNENGGLAFYFEDVTERKERERRLDAVFNKTYQFTGLMEPDGTLIKANDTALEFGGLTEEEVLGKSVWETEWFQMGRETKQRLRQAVSEAAGGTFVRYEVEVQGEDDTRIIDFSIRPVRNDDGEVVLLIPEGRDITERKSAEEKLREEGVETSASPTSS